MEFINNTKANVAATTGDAVPSNADASSAVAPPLAKKNPTDFLKQVIGKPVIVKLYSGVTYKGDALVDDDD